MTGLNLLTFFSYGLGIGVFVWLLAIGFKFIIQACFGSESSIENPIEWEKNG